MMYRFLRGNSHKKTKSFLMTKYNQEKILYFLIGYKKPLNEEYIIYRNLCSC